MAIHLTRNIDTFYVSKTATVQNNHTVIRLVKKKKTIQFVLDNSYFCYSLWSKLNWQLKKKSKTMG